MKKIFLAVAVLGLAAAASTAHAGVRFSIGIPAPVVSYGYAAPVYCPPARVYYAPAPVCVAPAPVCVPAPVFCAPPVVYAPRPVVRIGFGFDHYRPFYRHGRW